MTDWLGCFGRWVLGRLGAEEGKGARVKVGFVRGNVTVIHVHLGASIREQPRREFQGDRLEEPHAATGEGHE